MDELIALSEDWESENSCHGYRKNAPEDIEGRRVFLAEDGGKTAGYLFGQMEKSENMTSVMPEKTPYFEVEEIYVIPELRSKGALQICRRRRPPRSGIRSPLHRHEELALHPSLLY